MKKCASIRSGLVAFLSGELEGSARDEIRVHLESCAECRREMAALECVVREARSLGPEVESEMQAVDWDARAEAITAAVWAKGAGRRPATDRRRFRLLMPAFRPVLAALVIGIMLGALATFMIFKGSPSRRGGGDRYVASAEFLDRVDLEIARRDTLDYLDRSQYVLLDIVGSEPGAGRAAAGQARELLAKKKLLNTELERAQMVKAKEICDQIEVLFYQLADVTSGLTAAERAELKSLIEGRDIFLKIRLLKRELQESEV